jgi:hypothetical protein
VSTDQPRNIPQALTWLTYLTERAAKHRTTEWLHQCREAYIAGTDWPPAPRYKGPLQDLDALTDEALDQLQAAIVSEKTKREVTP